MCQFNTGCPGHQTHEGYFPCNTESGCASDMEELYILRIVSRDSAVGIEVLERYFDFETNTPWAIGKDVDGRHVTWAL